MMTQTLLIIIAAILFILVCIFAYNIHQENQYRRKIRSQFGHSDNDALMQSQTHSVRDGQGQTQAVQKRLRPNLTPAHHATTQNETPKKERANTPKIQKNTIKTNDKAKSFFKNLETPIVAVKQAAEKVQEVAKPVIAEALPQNENVPTAAPTPTNAETAAELTFEPIQTTAPSEPTHKREPIVNLHDLSQNRLAWFDPRFDYMAYVSLRSPQELHALPRLSSRYRFQIIGCTYDHRFQIAEPIPGVSYRAFVIGLQAISRNGLSSAQELEQFGLQVRQFAEKMDGEYLLTDIPTFLNMAKPLDDICARVDQTIAIHLVSRTSISGTEIRNHLENKGFQLMHDGSFSYHTEKGQPKFNIVTLDGSAFTSSLLSTQAYKGFSMLFDITRVPAGREHFDEFMNIALSLAIALNLDLVNDQVQELTNEWLKEICHYVLARQEEMLKVGIEPGEALAQRLFT